MIPHPNKRLKNLISLITAVVIVCLAAKMQAANAQTKKSTVINMVLISDVHYGITRANFRGDTGVRSQVVNEAMIAQLNSLPKTILPADDGIGAGNPDGAIEGMALTGDIANKMDPGVQRASTSWAQFVSDYLSGGLKLKTSSGQATPMFLVPGNHDITNAIGSSKPMKPTTDPSSMVGMYNLMVKPDMSLSGDMYDYSEYKINYSKNIGGVHMMFITLWPDSVERIWMQKDLASVDKTIPVIIFTHDPPIADPKHFTNPVAPHEMNTENGFENLLAENYKESPTAKGDGGSTAVEQRGLVKFLKAHPNIKAYIHGHSNYNEFYTYRGPDNDIDLKVFRVDSPMKGRYSAPDEKLQSFLLISIDSQTLQMTARECLWNTEPRNKNQKIVFGKSQTISLKVD